MKTDAVGRAASPLAAAGTHGVTRPTDVRGHLRATVVRAGVHREGRTRPRSLERSRGGWTLRPTFRFNATPPSLALLVALLAGCRPTRPPETTPPIVLFEPARPRTDSRRSHTYLGIVRGETEADLSFKVGGLLDAIGDARGDWREGDAVTNRQEVARLKPEDFVSTLQQAEAQALFARQRWTNNHQLFFASEPAISRQEWERTEADLHATQAERDRAAQSMHDSRLLAPFDGRILARLANRGEMVMAGRTVLRLTKVRPFVSVELGVPDRVVAQVRQMSPTHQVRVRITALDWTNFTGVVSEVGEGAREGSRLFRVVVNVNNEHELIRSGMTASVTFEGTPEARPDDVVVPLSALVAASDRVPREGENQLAVFIVGEDDRVHERAVWTDDIVRSSIIVTNNLKWASHAQANVRPQERVVVVGASQLRDGQTVVPRPRPGGERPAVPTDPPPAPPAAR